MKEILFCVIILINIYSLYKMPTKINVGIILITTLLLISYSLNSYQRYTAKQKEHFVDQNGLVTFSDNPGGMLSVTSADGSDSQRDITGIVGSEFDKFFYDKSFREPMFTDLKYERLRKNLNYYVSTFDSRYVDLTTGVLKSHVNSDKLASISFNNQLLTDNETKFHQENGIKVIKVLEAPSANALLNGIFEEFVMFWYCKFDFQEKWFYYSDRNDAEVETYKVHRPCYKYTYRNDNGENFDANIGDANVCLGKDKLRNATQRNKYKYSFCVFDHANIETSRNNFKLLEIEFEFIPGNYNPNIYLKFADTTSSGNLNYTYKPSDFYANKIIGDGKFHLFTFIKWGQNVYLFMDDKVLINCNIPGDCFVPSNYKIYQNDRGIKIRDSPLLMNKNDLQIDSAGVPVELGLQFNLNAFGVYSEKTFDAENTPYTFVTELNAYFRNIKDYMMAYKRFGINDETMSLKKQLSEAQNKLKSLEYQKCPFNNSQLCNTMECQYINNWNNFGHLADTPLCFEKVMSYCNSDSNVNKEQYCAYLNSKNIGLLARNLVKDTDFLSGIGRDNLNKIGEAGCKYDGQRLDIIDIVPDNTIRNTGTQNILNTNLDNNVRITNNAATAPNGTSPNLEEPDDTVINQYNQLLQASSTTPPPPPLPSSGALNLEDELAALSG